MRPTPTTEVRIFRLLGVGLLACLVLCSAAVETVLGCSPADVTDIEVWVGKDEDQAKGAVKRSASIPFDLTPSFGVFVKWEADGGTTDGNFYIEVRERLESGSNLLASSWHADHDTPWEHSFTITPGWSSPGTHKIFARVTRSGYNYHDSEGYMGFDCTVYMVKVQTIVDRSLGGDDEGPLERCLGTVRVSLMAIPTAGGFPDGQPNWAITDYPTGLTPAPTLDENQGMYTGIIGLGEPGEYKVKATCGTADTGHEISIHVINQAKIPLGGSAPLSKYFVGKVYVPTRYGGTLKLTAGTNVELFYTDGANLDYNCDMVLAIVKGEADFYKVAEGNPCQYSETSEKWRWYYVRVDTTSPVSVSSEFTQSKTVTKSPWPLWWFPYADEDSLGTDQENLYDPGHCLDLYDTAYSTNSMDREKLCWYSNGFGHFIAKPVVKECDAEITWGRDLNDADGDGDWSTGWDPGYTMDFWNGPSPGDGDPSHYGGDGDTTDEVNVGWYGHCGIMTAVIIREDEPTGNYSAPNGVVFTPKEKKGLLVALYHGFYSFDPKGPDILPHEWHFTLEKYILALDVMFGADIYNSGSGADVVSNCPIYGIDEAKYVEKPGQDDEKVVQIISKIKYWTGSSSGTKNYEYNVSYNSEGIASLSETSDWVSVETPDSAWLPHRQTEVHDRWLDELDYDTIKAIIPLN